MGFVRETKRSALRRGEQSFSAQLVPSAEVGWSPRFNSIALTQVPALALPPPKPPTSPLTECVATQSLAPLLRPSPLESLLVAKSSPPLGNPPLTPRAPCLRPSHSTPPPSSGIVQLEHTCFFVSDIGIFDVCKTQIGLRWQCEQITSQMLNLAPPHIHHCRNSVWIFEGRRAQKSIRESW